MLRQVMLFLLSGGVATSAHYAVLIALVHLGHGAVAASTCGALCGALINYGLNRRYTFRSRRAHVQALPRYLATAGGGLLLNGLLVNAVVAARMHYLVAQTVATAVVLVWSFAVNRWWTFRGAGYAQ